MSTTAEQTRLKVLSVHQPYAWALAAGFKPIENRAWAPPRTLLGGFLAIHAAKTTERMGDIPRVAELAGVMPSELSFGAILAVVRVTGFAASVEQLPPSSRPWFTGPFAWVFSELRRLPTPVPARGQQGLWTPSPTELAEVRRQWQVAEERQPVRMTPAGE